MLTEVEEDTCSDPPSTESHTRSFFIQRKLSKHRKEVMTIKTNGTSLSHHTGRILSLPHVKDLWRDRRHTAKRQAHCRTSMESRDQELLKPRLLHVQDGQNDIAKIWSSAAVKNKAVSIEKRDKFDPTELPIIALCDINLKSGGRKENHHQNSEHDCQTFVFHNDKMTYEKQYEVREAGQQQAAPADFLFDSCYRQELQSIASTPGALHAAASKGDMDCMSVLVELGADVNGTYRERTPLMAAVTWQAVGYLIQHGADVNKTIVTSDGEKTAIHNAMSPHYISTLRTRTGASDVFGELEKIVMKLVHGGAKLSIVDSAGNTPLMAACEMGGSGSILKFLSQADGQRQPINAGGESVFHLAARSNSVENVKAVTDGSCQDVNLQNVMGTTALMIAAMNRNKDIVEYLIHQGASVNIRDRGGDTCLTHAVKSCSHEVEHIRMLLEAGADPNIENGTYYCPLTLAAADLNEQVLKVLLEPQFAVEEDRKERALGLLLAGNVFTQSTINCVSILLDHDTSSSKINPNIIHKFAADGHTELVRKLINNGTPPADVGRDDPRVLSYCWPVPNASPLCASLLANQHCLARTLAELWYFTPSDFRLASNARLKEHLSRNGQTECVALLKDMSYHITSLRVLSFTAISAAVTCGSNRARAIQSLHIPDIVKNMLLFRDQRRFKEVDSNYIKSAVHQSH